MKAPNTVKELVINGDSRLMRRNDLKVAWTRMNSHGHNSFLVNATKAYNKYCLNTEYFENENEFKVQLKLRCFSRNKNGNII